MVDYNSHKVPELKKLLADRSLPTTGVKADLISRLQDDDKTKSSPSPATMSAPQTGEDEIDWDEDDTKATTAPAAAAVAAGGQGSIQTPAAAVPNQISSTDPSKTSDLKVTQSTAAKPATAKDSKPAEPKETFAANLAPTDAELEAIKRAERIKKFGPVVAADASVDSDEAKKAERAKKFGLDSEKKTDFKGLDSALPGRGERKRGREDQGGRYGGAKRQNGGGRNGRNDGGGGGRNGRNGVAGGNGVRRTGGGDGGGNGVRRTGGGDGGGRARKVTDDPVEKAKAEARANKFKS